jgi:acetolactate synthase I/III small subunit
MRQVIQIELEDKPGALIRVAGVLTATGSNIDSLIVSPAPVKQGISSMMIVVEIEPRLRRRVIQLINRLVNVLDAQDITDTSIENVFRYFDASQRAIPGLRPPPTLE